jgi:hypothetical protein
MCAKGARSLAIVWATLALAGCGLSNPKIAEGWDTDFPADPKTHTPPVSATAQIELEIKKKIYCELKDAVYEANHYPVTESAHLGGKQTVKYRSLIPPGWIAQVVLSLQVDESVALNPGLTYTQAMANATQTFGVMNSVTTPQSFSLGLGATVSSTATRIDKFNPQYSIEFLSKAKTKDSICDDANDPFARIGWQTPTSSPFLIESKLGIEEWLLGAMVVNDIVPSDVTITTPAPAKKPAPISPRAEAAPGGSAGGGGSGGAGAGGGGVKADTVTYEIKFVIVTSGNVTPTWRLLRVTANGTAPFFATGRTRTHDLIITVGPDSTVTSNANLSSQISAGVNNGLRRTD